MTRSRFSREGLHHGLLRSRNFKKADSDSREREASSSDILSEIIEIQKSKSMSDSASREKEARRSEIREVQKSKSMSESASREREARSSGILYENREVQKSKSMLQATDGSQCTLGLKKDGGGSISIQIDEDNSDTRQLLRGQETSQNASLNLQVPDRSVSEANYWMTMCCTVQIDDDNSNARQLPREREISQNASLDLQVPDRSIHDTNSGMPPYCIVVVVVVFVLLLILNLTHVMDPNKGDHSRKTK